VYWDAYERVSACEVCGSRTTFENLARGYARTCSHVCGGKLYRAELKADHARNAQFKDRISSAQAAVWANRSIAECKQIFLKGLKSSTFEKLEQISIGDARQLGLTLTSIEPFFDQVQRVVNVNINAFLGCENG
jgi:hypothetical protein